MKLMTVKQLMKKSKTALIRKITKSLRSMPKKKLAMLCYEMSKSKLPRLRTTKQKALPKRKTKRKFSAKQLAAQRLFAKRARAGTLRR
jgi:predicted transcriptional regulator YheO